MVAAVKGMRQVDSRPWLATITAPTLVVAGADDQAVPRHHFQMLTERIPRVESRVVDGAGHGLLWTHTSVFAEIVRDWLQKPRAHEVG
jgi:3-oxoadipate enol-lactonase